MPAEGMEQRNKTLRSQIAIASDSIGIGNVDPVYIMTRCFKQSFDMVGKQRAAEMSSDKHGDKNSNNSLSEYDLRKKYDFAMYSHSYSQLKNGEFCDRFSSYAFRGGKLAGAVLTGQSRNIFISCVARAAGLQGAQNEKQRKICGASAIEDRLDGQSASVVFNNYDAQSAVGIILDAIQGATSIFEVFRSIVNGTDGTCQESPLKMRGIHTMTSLYPFLKTDGDKALIEKYRAEIKALEGNNSPEALQQKQCLEAALKKETAVLNCKMTEQRKFLTLLEEMESNARYAEKMFSSDGFAEEITEEINEKQNDTPPSGGKGGGRRSLNATEVSHESGPDAEQQTEFSEAERTESEERHTE